MKNFTLIAFIALVVCSTARAQTGEPTLTVKPTSSLASKQPTPFWKQPKWYVGKAVFYAGAWADYHSTQKGIASGRFCEGTRFLKSEDGCSLRAGRYWLTNVALDLAFTPFDLKFGWFTFGFRVTVGTVHARAWLRNEKLNRGALR
jgi:hypothetical protein